MAEHLRAVRSEETEAIIRGLRSDQPLGKTIMTLGQAGVSMAELAAVCEVEESDVAAWENGNEIPHAPSIILRDIRMIMQILIKEAALEPAQAAEVLTKKFEGPEEPNSVSLREGERPIDVLVVDPLRAEVYASSYAQSSPSH